MTTELAVIPSQENLPTELERLEHLLPTQVLIAGEKTSWSFLNFFAAQIRNHNTREAYYRDVKRFFDWCEAHPQIHGLTDIKPIYVSAYIELLGNTMSKPSVKQHLAAIRKCLNYLVAHGSVLEVNPASPVSGPRYKVTRGKTEPLTEAQMRQLFEAIDTTTLAGLRDRALIGVMLYSFARIGAVVAMNVEDFYSTGVQWRLRLHEKGNVDHNVPAHHLAAEYLHAYLEAARLWTDKKGPLFRPFVPLSRTELRPPELDRLGQRLDRLDRRNAWQMVKRRAVTAGIPADMAKNHTFRSTGITVFRRNGGSLADAQTIAAHASSQTTKIYDHSDDPIQLEEIERVRI